MSYDLQAILARAYDFGTLDDPNHKHIGADGHPTPCRNPELCAAEAAEAAAYLDPDQVRDHVGEVAGDE
jgi:hypothetical protein